MVPIVARGMVGPFIGSIFNEVDAKGLSCTIVPYARSWFGLISVCCNVSPIQRASLNIRINSSPSCGEVHNVAPVTTGTSVIESYVSEYGSTSQLCPVCDRMMVLAPKTMVSAWLSSSMRPCVGSDVGLFLTLAALGQRTLDTILETRWHRCSCPCAIKLSTCVVTVWELYDGCTRGTSQSLLTLNLEARPPKAFPASLRGGGLVDPSSTVSSLLEISSATDLFMAWMSSVRDDRSETFLL